MRDWLGRDVSGGKGNDFAGANYDAQPTIEYMKGKGIQDFKAQMRRGFARPNIFSVDISSVSTEKAAKYRMSCFQAQIPGVSLATTDKDIGYRSVAYQKLFADITLGFYVSAGLEELQFWQSWIDFIVDPATNHFNYPKHYYGTIRVTPYSRDGSPSATWTFIDAYPKAVDAIALDYGTNDTVMTLNVSITYRHYTHEYLAEQTKTAIAADVAPRPSGDFQTLMAGPRKEIDTFKDKGENFLNNFSNMARSKINQMIEV